MLLEYGGAHDDIYFRIAYGMIGKDGNFPEAEKRVEQTICAVESPCDERLEYIPHTLFLYDEHKAERVTFFAFRSKLCKKKIERPVPEVEDRSCESRHGEHDGIEIREDRTAADRADAHIRKAGIFENKGESFFRIAKIIARIRMIADPERNEADELPTRFHDAPYLAEEVLVMIDMFEYVAQNDGVSGIIFIREYMMLEIYARDGAVNRLDSHTVFFPEVIKVVRIAAASDIDDVAPQQLLRHRAVHKDAQHGLPFIQMFERVNQVVHDCSDCMIFGMRFESEWSLRMVSTRSRLSRASLRMASAIASGVGSTLCTGKYFLSQCVVVMTLQSHATASRTTLSILPVVLACTKCAAFRYSSLSSVCVSPPRNVTSPPSSCATFSSVARPDPSPAIRSARPAFFAALMIRS